MRIGIVLGGGFTPDGQLTELSLQRLNAGRDLYKDGKIQKILVLGAQKSTYLPNAIVFPLAGAEVRKDYLIQNDIPDADILPVLQGHDTIGEAIACKEYLAAQSSPDLTLITSDKHMPRALWVFQTILGSAYTISNYTVPCGDLLIVEEEGAYLHVTQEYFTKHSPEIIPDGNWHATHPDLYSNFKKIHDVYHPPGNESQAYMAVKNPK